MEDHRSAIEFKDILLAFDEQVVLNRVSFTVQPGETKVLMGGSGTGKSTVLKLVLGLLKPDEGRIYVDGEDVTKFSEPQMMAVRQKIGMVFQEGALFDSLTVYENVGFRLFEQGVNEDEIEHIVRQMLRFVNLEDAIYKMPAELSGGMRRRVGIARALVGKPKIILYDEPTAGLDPPTARTIIELAMKLRDLEGVSSIFVTHRIQDAQQLASEYVTIDENGELIVCKNEEGFADRHTRFIMLKQGNVVFSGSGKELWSSPDPYIKNFLS
ncbi:MAG: ATP-binding cassette domain-containing protein [Acidobacteriota bacterium]